MNEYVTGNLNTVGHVGIVIDAGIVIHGLVGPRTKAARRSAAVPSRTDASRHDHSIALVGTQLLLREIDLDTLGAAKAPSETRFRRGAPLFAGRLLLRLIVGFLSIESLEQGLILPVGWGCREEDN